MLLADYENTKPVVCAVQGYAYGAGFRFVLHSDLSVADTTAKFQFTEIVRGLVNDVHGVLAIKSIRLRPAGATMFTAIVVEVARTLPIDEIVRTRKPQERVTLSSPINGTVTEKMVVKKSAVKAGDVLYTVTGSFGIPVILRDSKEFCFQRQIGLVRPKPETNSDWLYYLLLSPQVFTQAAEGATGTAQKTVSLRVLRNFQVPRVAIDHQIKDASKLAAISHETQRLATIYERKLAALDDLKKSLLHQAFSGEL